MAPGNYVLLSVADNGHGMDLETKAHIFEPFFTTKEIGKGTGLGLATVYGVVKQSGGFIYVDSAAGKGARFEIYLPQAAEAVQKSETHAKPMAIPAGTETILVVEDEADVRELTCEFLKVSGYTVLQAQNGVEALEICARHSGVIHLVLSDMVMPKMGGAELAVKLAKARPGTKVVLMSGYSDYSNGPRGLLSPDALILQKPFSRPSLVEKVREALTRTSVEQTTGAD
jgi:CheY-like chemotaxis protein